jgi:arsenite methyltransferase
MRRELLEILVEPLSRRPLELEGAVERAGEVVSGRLRGEGRTYAVREGIPRLVPEELDAGQAQTGRSFGFKWGRRDSYESPELADLARDWLVGRYGFASVDAMREHFGERSRLLDAGCGSGFSALLWTEGWQEGPDWVGADLSDAVDVARTRLADLPRADFVQADLVRLPFLDETFDVVFAEGVLHHTPSTWAALESIVRVLAPGGEACFYVYRRKAPLREFADDHVRAAISGADPEEAWELLRPLTRLGQALSELNAEVEVPEDVPYLGIRAGRYDVQRLIYWNFAKLFWNDQLSFEANNHVNFDWYHPRYAHRHTEEELRDACAATGLRIVHLDAQDSGFTVRALKD